MPPTLSFVHQLEKHFIRLFRKLEKPLSHFMTYWKLLGYQGHLRVIYIFKVIGEYQLPFFRYVQNML